MRNFIITIASGIWQLILICEDKIKYHGADFGLFVRRKKLGWTENTGNEYKASTISNLKYVLNRLPITCKDSVLDIGCGKGKVAYIMSSYPFAYIHGYDLNENLVNIANRNFELLNVNSKCHSFIADAARFEGYDNYNYFYFFNSVPYDIFIKMIGKLNDSINRNPRKVYFIYMHPEQESFLLKNTAFKKIMSRKHFLSFLVDWFDITVYSNER